MFKPQGIITPIVTPMTKTRKSTKESCALRSTGKSPAGSAGSLRWAPTGRFTP